MGHEVLLLCTEYSSPGINFLVFSGKLVGHTSIFLPPCALLHLLRAQQSARLESAPSNSR